jgi:hypothetical protein
MAGPSYRNPIPFSSATLGRQVPVASSYSTYNVPQRRIFPTENQAASIPYGPLIPPPNPYHTSSNAYKSNSLPRRRVASEIMPVRTVKWRNDVVGPSTSGFNDDEQLYTDRSAFSDIGAITSPRMPRRYDMEMRANSTISSPGTIHSK